MSYDGRNRLRWPSGIMIAVLSLRILLPGAVAYADHVPRNDLVARQFTPRQLVYPLPQDRCRAGRSANVIPVSDSGADSMPQALKELLAPFFRPAYPLCTADDLPVMNTLRLTSGHYSAAPLYGDLQNSAESLSLTAASPTEGTIICYWERRAGPAGTRIDGRPNQGWAGFGGGLIQPCAVSYPFDLDIEVVSRAMLDVYTANPQAFTRCQPQPPPADDDSDGNGLNDSWESDQGEDGDGGTATSRGLLPARKAPGFLSASLHMPWAEARPFSAAYSAQGRQERQSGGVAPAAHWTSNGMDVMPVAAGPAACIGCAVAAIGASAALLDALTDADVVRIAQNDAAAFLGWDVAFVRFFTGALALAGLSACILCFPSLAAGVFAVLSDRTFLVTGLVIGAAVCAIGNVVANFFGLARPCDFF